MAERAQLRQFWVLIATGMPSADAGVAVGVSGNGGGVRVGGGEEPHRRLGRLD